MYKESLTIWYNVSNVLNTKEFYEEKLKFECKLYDEEGGMVIMAANTPHVEIGFSEAVEVQASSTSTVFEVIDIEKSVNILRERGIEFVGGIDIIPGLVKLATFTDPDGHSLMLAESLTDG